MTDYNYLANLYHFAKKNPVKQYSEEFSFFKNLGNVRGKSVFDLACGDGYYTRQIKMNGASLVVGADISEKMIERARNIEKRLASGINYTIFDVCQPRKIGAFDIVTSVYLFPYARTLNMLNQMCETIVLNLKPDGKMISVTLSPFVSNEILNAQIYYDVEMTTTSRLTDGAMIHIKIITEQGNICFDNTYWSKKTYEQALGKAGFKSIVWHKPQISEAGIQQYGKSYWHKHLSLPGFSVLVCYL
jgi:2-polyprenyl-3-methyl-5-hydroxy-6-metoxy-1,4-benzoquinol methylase